MNAGRTLLIDTLVLFTPFVSVFLEKNDVLLTRCKTRGLRHLSVVQGVYKVESNISFSALGLFSFMLWYEKYVPW